jgi:hypothetical protein
MKGEVVFVFHGPYSCFRRLSGDDDDSQSHAAVPVACKTGLSAPEKQASGSLGASCMGSTMSYFLRNLGNFRHYYSVKIGHLS